MRCKQRMMLLQFITDRGHCCHCYDLLHTSSLSLSLFLSFCLFHSLTYLRYHLTVYAILSDHVKAVLLQGPLSLSLSLSLALYLSLSLPLSLSLSLSLSRSLWGDLFPPPFKHDCYWSASCHYSKLIKYIYFFFVALSFPWEKCCHSVSVASGQGWLCWS